MWTALRKLHRWMGLALSLPLLVTAVSGFILAGTPVWEELSEPPDSPAAGPVHTASAIIATSRAASPGLTPVRYHPGSGPRSLAVVDLAKPAQRMPELRLVIDPVTLAVTRTVLRPGRFYRFMHGLHEQLLIPRAGGRAIVGWIGVGLLILSVIGLPLWWNTRPMAVPRKKRRGLLLWHALHRGFGIWLAAMLILQAGSGIALAFPRTFRALAGLPDPGSRRGAHGIAAAPDIDTALERARAAIPHARLLDLLLPSTAGRPAIAVFQPDGTRDGGPFARADIDLGEQRILTVQDPRSQNFGARLLCWARALHSGGGLGFPWRAATCVAGLTLPLFPVTGLAMWLMRRRGARASRSRVSIPLSAE